MRYKSTRGGAPDLGFEDVLLTGLATDGGLYLPESWPQFSKDEIKKFEALDYPALAVEIMAPFVAPDITKAELKGLVGKAYSTFHHKEIVPLRRLDNNLYVEELFHGPTLAFKDVALQLLGHLFDFVLQKHGKRITIVGATSGDTGSAAIEGCKGRENIDIFILHPHGRVSTVQRKQMTSVIADNVHNIALKGTFDDCQNIVKDLFNDLEFRTKHQLSAVNSINWARIMAQIVYYFYAALQTKNWQNGVTIIVPTGNFGNMLAAYAAHRMGLPVKKMVVATNRNDILHRFFETGSMTAQPVAPTISPSMDIQISSNFERLLFEYLDRDTTKTARLMQELKQQQNFSVLAPVLDKMKTLFASCRCDEDGTHETMRIFHEKYGYMADPHTAVGLFSVLSQKHDFDTPVIVMGTAHPAKFPDAVKAATGKEPPLPEFLSDLYDRPEKFDILDNSFQSVRDYIDQHG